MTPELIQKAWKILQDISIKYHKDIYSQLGVTLQPKDYDPESWYGGMPQPHTGKCLPPKYQCKTVVKTLLGTIQQKTPLCKEKSDKFNWIVWPKGDNIPTYLHSCGGINWQSGKPIDHHDKSGFSRLKPSKGKFLSSGKYGLGVTYAMACKMWGKKTVDKLPLKEDNTNDN